MFQLILFVLLVFNRVQYSVGYHSNHIVYHLRHSDNEREIGQEVAERHRLQYVGPVFTNGRSDNSYHHAIVTKSTGREINRLLTDMSADPQIGWVERQTFQPRQLRFISNHLHPLYSENEERIFRTDPDRRNPMEFNDPLYPLQWYLHGMNGQSRYHLNVTAAWRQGLTGRGSAIAVLDDEINILNPDLKHNYDRSISGDLGARSGPGLKKNPVHGTYCAAVIAAEANNSFCGVGVAYGARVGGVRLLAKKRVLDLQEARALNYKMADIDIYSASWGPPDDGQHIGGPGVLARHALQRGVHEGRGGLGAIYIWASGNGGMKGDHCGYDSYASSIYTITVSSLTPNGRSPYYAEPCPPALTSLYVGGQHDRPQSAKDIHPTSNVVVSFGDDGCQNQFQGTSAAAPLAAGIVALLLEANPRLYWRDVQHLIVLNSHPPPNPDGNGQDWPANGAGLRSNPLYGFGALNAGRLVEMGRQWTNVPPQIRQTLFPSALVSSGSKSLPDGGIVKLDIKVDNQNSLINSLEYVLLTIDVEIHPSVGGLSISLQSPSGMKSAILAPRWNDKTKTKLSNWNLTSSQFWSERPTGLWRITFTNNNNNNKSNKSNLNNNNSKVTGHSLPAVLHSCSLTLFGF